MLTSVSVDYYEELGVSRTASAEEIRRSYKRLARLFHPDHQSDPELRAAAEVQMRRLNEILALLTDPMERMRYDLIFDSEPEDANPRSRWAMPRPLLRLNLKSWVWFAAGAVLACMIARWIVEPRSADRPETATNAAALAASAAKAPDEVTLLDRRIEELRRRYPPDPARAEAATTAANPITAPAPSRPAPSLPATFPATSPAPGAAPPPSRQAVVASTIAAEAPVPAPTARPERRPAPARSGLPGLWRYTMTGHPSTLPGVFAAERVEVAVTEQSGVIYGYFLGRYAVSGSSVSPDVDFRFSGPAGTEMTKLAWAGMNGNRGEINLRPLPGDALEVVWVTTHMEHMGNLASGQITLHRVGE
jgi:DnaJ domain